MATIFHPLSPQDNIWQEDSRDIEGGRGESERARERGSKEGEREVQELLIQATVNGRIIAPRTCLGLSWISHKWDKPAHVYEGVLPSGPESQNVSITIPAPYWKQV